MKHQQRHHGDRETSSPADTALDLTAEDHAVAKRMTRRSFIGYSALSAGALSIGGLAACGSSTSTVSQGPPRRGGHLIFAVPEPPTATGSFDDSNNAIGTSYLLASLVQDFLIQRDATGRFVPGLATDWRFERPGSLRMTLRQGVRYHDGTVFGAEDVKTQIERVSSNSSLAWAAFWAPTKVEILGPYDVRIINDPPFAPLLASLAWTSIPPKTFTAHPARFVGHTIGAGPFRFMGHSGNDVLLEGNPDYWGGRPYLDQITVRYISDPNAALNALLAGEVHIMRDVSALQLKAASSGSFYTVPGENGNAIQVLLVDKKAPALLKPRVREALMYALGRDTVLSQIYGNSYVARYSRPAGNVFAHDVPFWTAAPNQYSHNPSLAKRLLDESGAGSITLTQASSTFEPQQSDLDQLIAQRFTSVGVKVVTTPMDVGKFDSTFFNFGCSLVGFTCDNNDFDSVSAAIVQYASLFGWDGLEPYSKLHEAQRTALTATQRQAAITRAADFLWNNLPFLPLSDLQAPRLVSSRVKNYKRNGTFHDALLREASLT